MRLLLTALGSYGDVHPMVGLGQAMRERGHQVSVITNPHFKPVVESAGLQMIPIGTIAEYDELAHHADLWHPSRGPMMLLRMCFRDRLRELYELIVANCVQGETVLGAHGLDIASRIVLEKHQVPMASIHYAPIAMRSTIRSPRMFSMLLDDWVPTWLKRMQFWLADCAIDRWFGSELNSLRSELGLPPIKRFMQQWYYSPQRVIGLFPDWYAPPQLDWPAQVALTGFPLWDQATEERLPTDVEDFLSGGEGPIVFCPGSAMTEGQAFFAAAVDACRRLGRRGILLTKYPDQLPANLPPEVRHFGFVPFSHLLPRAAAFIHHGGMGSSAQGLASGVPHLVMPMAYDQLDNATRLKRLGVGTYLRRRKFQGPTVARCLDQLLTSSPTREQCSRWAQQCDGQASLGAACDLLEQLATKNLSHP